MAKENTSGHPGAIVFRNEPFGGLIFAPDDAVHMELDHEAWEVVLGWYQNRRRPRTWQEAKLLISIAKEIGLFPGAKRFYTNKNRNEGAVPVYAAPTLVDFQITDKCFMNCPHCYASSVPEGEHVPWAQIIKVFDELEKQGVCQIAIGGGEPLLHPRFGDLLALSRSKGVVPNVTTAGTHLTPKNLSVLKKYCGAVAVSLEDIGDGFMTRRKSGFTLFEKAIQKLLKAEIPTVIQVTLSDENLDQLPQIADYCQQVKGLYGVIFLAYKSVGRGIGFNQPLAVRPAGEVFKRLRSTFLKLSKYTRVGYDCCLAPGIAGLDREMGFEEHDMLEGCSAMRHSFGIDTSLNVIPCTFVQDKVMGNLKDGDLGTIWDGQNGEAFRSRFANQVADNRSCSTCRSNQSCLGGCPVFSLVNCSRDYLNNRIKKDRASGEN